MEFVRTHSIMAKAIDNLLGRLGPEVEDHEEGTYTENKLKSSIRLV